jgi:hypothetical protein
MSSTIEVKGQWEDGTAVEAPQFYEDPEMNPAMYGQDNKLIVHFYQQVFRDNFKSKGLGRPVHVTQDFIRIIFPGDRLRVIEREASEHDKARFATKWLMYKAGKSEEVQGTLLSTWGAMAPNLAADYAALNVKTVEQLASADELMITNLGMGAREWKTRAQAYLAATGRSTELVDELAALRERIALLEAEKAPPVAPLAADPVAEAEAAETPAKPMTAIEKQKALAAEAQAKALATANKQPPFSVPK